MIADNFQKETILLIEKEPISRRSLRKMISRRLPWLQVIEANGFHDAVLKVAMYKPRIVIMEFIYAKQNGSRLIRTIKKADNSAFVVVYTNRDYPEYHQNALQCGADGFFSKITDRGEDMLALIDQKLKVTIPIVVQKEST